MAPVTNSTQSQSGATSATLWPDTSLLSQSLLTLSVQTVCADSKRSLRNYGYGKTKALVYLPTGSEYTGSQQKLVLHDISDIFDCMVWAEKKKVLKISTNITDSITSEVCCIQTEVSDVGARVLGCCKQSRNGIDQEWTILIPLFPTSLNLETTDTPFKQFYVLLGLNIQEIIKTFFPNSSFHLLLKAVRCFFAEHLKMYTNGPIDNLWWHTQLILDSFS